MSSFDRSDRFQQELPDVLTAIAAPRMPDYVDDLLAQAAATRQRPRWTFPERWLPMGAIARRQPYVPIPAWRLFLVAALLLALAAAALLVTAGSQQHVPPPFGPARNGAVLFGNGDIYIRDTLDGPARLVIGGPTFDFAAGFTRDGTRLTFLRRVAGTEGSPDERLQAFTADTDGSNVAPLTAPLVAPDWFGFRPRQRIDRLHRRRPGDAAVPVRRQRRTARRTAAAAHRQPADVRDLPELPRPDR